MLQRTPWKRLGLAVLTLPILTLGIAACRPTGPPAPPGAPSCFGAHMTAPADPAIAQTIADAFAGTNVTDYMLHTIVPRESGCDPNAYNPSGAEGLFQLLGHQDLLNASCLYPAWWIPYCNAHAARLLYNSSGLAPWGG